MIAGLANFDAHGVDGATLIMVLAQAQPDQNRSQTGTCPLVPYGHAWFHRCNVADAIRI